MSAKDNFAQAMKELLNGNGEEAVKTEEEVKTAPSSFSSFSQPQKPADETSFANNASADNSLQGEEEKPSFGGFSFSSPKPAPAPAPAPAPLDESSEEVEAAVEEQQSNEAANATEDLSFGQPMNLETEQELQEEVAVELETEEAVEEVMEIEAETVVIEETEEIVEPEEQETPQPINTAETMERTIIAKGTTIVGHISTSGSLRINGNVKGNLRAGTIIELDGNVIGDIEAEDVLVNNSIVKGDIIASNNINMDSQSTIVGDVTATSADIDGKIKGNLTLDERAHFQPNTILMGNLVAGTVIIEEGAILKGDILITNAQVDDVVVEEPELEIDLDI